MPKANRVKGTVIEIRFVLPVNINAYVPCAEVILEDGRTAFWFVDEVVMNQNGISSGREISGFVYEHRAYGFTMRRVKY